MNSTSTTRPIPAEGSALAADAGHHTIRLYRTIENGFTLRVFTGPTEETDLADQFTDEHMARHAARTITRRLREGEDIRVLITEKLAAQAELIAAVNATMDKATAAYLAPREQARNIGAFATPARVNTRPLRGLSPAMIRALRAEQDGVIEVQPGVLASTLRAMAVGGLGTTEGDQRPHQVSRLHLNPTGRRLADEQKANA